MYQSADGNFILGWTASGFDVFFGVKALAITGANSITSGLYFTAALEDAPQYFGTDSYYGGTSNTGNSNGDGVVHQRLNVPMSLSIDYGTDDQINVNADGTAGPDFNGGRSGSPVTLISPDTAWIVKSIAKLSRSGPVSP